MEGGRRLRALDPEYPAERVRFMLEDTKAVVVLTQNLFLVALPVTDSSRSYIWTRKRNASRQALAAGPALLLVAGKTGVCDLYLGFDRQSQGCADQAHDPVSICLLAPAGLSCDASRPGHADHAVAFDASVWEIWPYLTAGAECAYP